MDEAILRHEHPDVARYRLLDEIPFDFQRRRMSVVVEGGGERLLVTKGAPESVLPACEAIELAGAPAPLDAPARAGSAALFRRLSGEGYRVLAVAYRPVAPQPAYAVADERGLRLVGFAAFLDPPREGVRETLAALHADGIAVKIITGDHELVTQRICAFAVMLGVFHADERLFRTGWFVESLATQTLVIFVIRTAGRPWESRPGAGLIWGVCACVVTGAVIPFTPLAPWLGFTPLPPLFFAILVLMVVTYLGLVEVVKRWFYRRYPT